MYVYVCTCMCLDYVVYAGLQKYHIEGGTVPPLNCDSKVGSKFYKKLEVGSQFCKKLEVGSQL